MVVESTAMPVVASIAVFIAVAVAAAAICWRIMYNRKPGPTAPMVPGVSNPQSPALPPGKPVRSNLFAITDERSARSAARQAMWAAFYCAFVTAAVSFLAGSGIEIIKGVGPTAWLDAAIFVALGIGIRGMSRLAAGGALLLYIVERIALYSSTGLNPIMMIAVVACFIQGLRGTLAFHKLRQQGPYPPLPVSPYPPQGQIQ